MSASTFRPMNDRVVVQRTVQEKTKSGIFLPNGGPKGPRIGVQGVIRAVGPGRYIKGGGYKEMDLSVGDKVIFPEYTGDDVEFDGVKCILLSEQDIFAVLDGED